MYGKPVRLSEVELNAARWLRKGFGSVGQARVTEQVRNGSAVYVIEAEVEGVPAHDPGYVRSVRRGFERFVKEGWGPLGVGTLKVEVLAGDKQNGKARAQLIVMPRRIEEGSA